MKVSSLLLFGALLAGCAQTYSTRPGSLPPSLAAVSAAERTTLWQHAVPALLEQGYVPQVLNEAAGYISAKRREDLNDDALTGTFVTVVVSAEGTVRVQLSGFGYYASELAFLDAVKQRQTQILQAIMAAPRTR